MKQIKRIIKYILSSSYRLICPICSQTKGTAAPVTLKNLFWQKFLAINKHAYWPVHYSSRVDGVKYIQIGIGTAPGLSIGCYIFAKKESPIYIGDYTIVASNVCVAGFSHDLYDYNKYPSKGGIKIGSYCWLGVNSVVLPGVEIGNHTIVAAGAVVTKSFSDGFCILAGNPAKKIKDLNRNLVVEKENQFLYRGYIKEEEFNSFKDKRLEV